MCVCVCVLQAAENLEKLKLEMEELQKQEDDWKKKEDELVKKEKVRVISVNLSL